MINKTLPITIFPSYEKAYDFATSICGDNADIATFNVKVDPAGSGKCIVDFYDLEGFFVGTM